MAKAFKDGGFQINQALYDAYASSGIQYGTDTAGEVPASFYTNDLRDTFSSYNDVAIVTFARYGTENTDLRATPQTANRCWPLPTTRQPCCR